MSPWPPYEGRRSLDDADQPSCLRVHLCVSVSNRSSLKHFVNSFPSLGTRASDRAWCKKTPVAVAFARSPPRSCRSHHSAPRLASYRNPAGFGLLKFLAPIAKRWRSFLQFPRKSRVHSELAIGGTLQADAYGTVPCYILLYFAARYSTGTIVWGY